MRRELGKLPKWDLVMKWIQDSLKMCHQVAHPVDTEYVAAQAYPKYDAGGEHNQAPPGHRTCETQDSHGPDRLWVQGILRAAKQMNLFSVTWQVYVR